MSKGYSDYFPALSKSSANPAVRSAFYASQGWVLADPEFTTLSYVDRVALFREILQNKIHGISFSPYIDGQSPGSKISEQQILHRLEMIKPYTKWIRSFSSIDGHQHTPAIAHAQGLKTLVGVSIGKDRALNEVELKNGIAVARDGYADILAIGNEVLLREDMNEDELLDYIFRAKQAVPGVPVGYVDAYFLFEDHPRLAEACDVILINCYPFWESTPAAYAHTHMKEMYRRALHIAQGKKVIISETGWPTIGSPYGAAVPGVENALKYFISTCQWAEQEGVEIFYFSSFDETWKVGDEGDVGAYWGLWDKDGNLKFV